jgi:hypothetical protein
LSRRLTPGTMLQLSASTVKTVVHLIGLGSADRPLVHIGLIAGSQRSSLGVDRRVPIRSMSHPHPA